MKLRRRSIISPVIRQLELAHPLLLDRDQGNVILPTHLREAGFTVECHSTLYTDNTIDDHVWIPECTTKGYIIVTSDKGIETDPINRRAVINSQARVIIVDNRGKTINKAASLIVSRTKIYTTVQSHRGPWYMSISLTTGLLVDGPRIPEDESLVS